MTRTILSLLLIFMFCLVACEGAIEGEDDDFADFDEPITEAEDDNQEKLDDEHEELDDGDAENFSGGDAGFTKKINVFGVEIWATDSISDEQLHHAAAVMAQYLDNDEDGLPDNSLITEAMDESNATLTMTADEAEEAEIAFSMLEEIRGDAQQMLYGYQTFPEGSTPANFDITLEEVLHLITTHGWADAYPDVWAEEAGSEAANAMDIARGGRFEQVPDEYPDGAWYTYDDETCDYGCMVGEYVYWAYTSLLGAQEYRMDEIEHEWRLGSAELLRETDTAIVELLTDPEFNFATVLPDGNYDALPLTIEPILP